MIETITIHKWPGRNISLDFPSPFLLLLIQKVALHLPIFREPLEADFKQLFGFLAKQEFVIRRKTIRPNTFNTSLNMCIYNKFVDTCFKLG